APAPASRGALPLEGVSPMDFQLRDCFKDFDPDAQQSTVVDCATGHSAQLVAVEKYGADESYPGREQLKQKARNACKEAPLTDKAGDYDLSYKLAYPSSRSWDKGDRRVDCYAVTDTGNVIMESLLP
ncbi:septum formation family protein, partial [Arthrobacter sp. Bi26]